MNDNRSSLPRDIPVRVLIAQAVRKGRMSKQQGEFFRNFNAGSLEVLLFCHGNLKDAVHVLP